MRHISVIRDGVKIKDNGVITPIHFMQQRLSKDEKIAIINNVIPTKLSTVEKTLLSKFL